MDPHNFNCTGVAYEERVTPEDGSELPKHVAVILWL
jgi:hypothetical protein